MFWKQSKQKRKKYQWLDALLLLKLRPQISYAYLCSSIVCVLRSKRKKEQWEKWKNKIK
jgi:hypothetical protein